MVLIIWLIWISVPSSFPMLGKPVGNPANWFADGDYRADASGAVRFKTIFAPDGELDLCVITATSGNKTLEKLACQIAFKRFRFRPSFDSQGNATNRVFERILNFSSAKIPDHVALKPMYMLRGAENLRKGGAFLVVDVDATGALRSCAASDAKSAVSAAQLCNFIAQAWRPLPEQDSAGRPIEYVRDIFVEVVDSAGDH